MRKTQKTNAAKQPATQAQPSWFEQAKAVADKPMTQEFGKAVVTGIGVAVGYAAISSIYHAVSA